MNFRSIIDKVITEEAEIFAASIRQRIFELMGMSAGGADVAEKTPQVRHGKPKGSKSKPTLSKNRKRIGRPPKPAGSNHRELRADFKRADARREAIYRATDETPRNWLELAKLARIPVKEQKRVQSELGLIGKTGAIVCDGVGRMAKWKRGGKPFDTKAVAAVAYARASSKNAEK